MHKNNDVRVKYVKGLEKMSTKPKRKPPPPKTRKFFEIKKKKNR